MRDWKQRVRKIYIGEWVIYQLIDDYREAILAYPKLEYSLLMIRLAWRY